jgi:hypothetical protein
MIVPKSHEAGVKEPCLDSSNSNSRRKDRSQASNHFSKNWPDNTRSTIRCHMQRGPGKKTVPQRGIPSNKVRTASSRLPRQEPSGIFSDLPKNLLIVMNSQASPENREAADEIRPASATVWTRPKLINPSHDTPAVVDWSTYFTVT